MYALIHVNVASKSQIWVVACSLPDGLPISYGTFPDCLCSHFETLWVAQSQGQSNPSAIVEMLWCCADGKTIAKSQPEVEINCILLYLSGAASYTGAFGPFGLGYLFYARLIKLSSLTLYCHCEGLLLPHKIRWDSRMPVVKTERTCRCVSTGELGDWGCAWAPLHDQPERKKGLGSLCCIRMCACFVCLCRCC